MWSEQVDTGAAGLSFRARLQSELGQRCRDNPQYSLRSFAMYLGIDHSTLSQLMRGKRVLTEDMIRRLAPTLKLDERDIELFIAYESVRSIDVSAATLALRRLIDDTSCLVSDPVHFQILELMGNEAFKPDSRWIAQVLDATTDEVNAALPRLIRAGFLQMVSGTSWVCRIPPERLTFDHFVKLLGQYLFEQLSLTQANEA